MARDQHRVHVRQPLLVALHKAMTSNVNFFIHRLGALEVMLVKLKKLDKFCHMHLPQVNSHPACQLLLRSLRVLTQMEQIECSNCDQINDEMSSNLSASDLGFDGHGRLGALLPRFDYRGTSLIRGRRWGTSLMRGRMCGGRGYVYNLGASDLGFDGHGGLPHP